MALQVTARNYVLRGGFTAYFNNVEVREVAPLVIPPITETASSFIVRTIDGNEHTVSPGELLRVTHDPRAGHGRYDSALGASTHLPPVNRYYDWTDDKRYSGDPEGNIVMLCADHAVVPAYRGDIEFAENGDVDCSCEFDGCTVRN